MLKPAVGRVLVVIAALAAVALAALLLSVKPVAERVLASQVAGGGAHVEGARLAWFGDEGAAGVRLRGVSLNDGKGRPVLKAQVVEAGIGLDSLSAPAPSRLVLKDFFVAASVSPQGGYALGYDAAGPPPLLRLDILLMSLTGEAHRDRPLSYLRHVDLERGVVLLRQVGGPVAWKARIEKVAFDKRDGQVSADTRLAIDDGLHTAQIRGQARGTVGLKSLVTGGSISGLVPARIFPAVSVTKPLSVLDAPLEGRARLEYAADRGITAADVTGRAGAGFLRLGGFVQAFQGAELATRYDPASKQVVLQAFRLEAERTRLNVNGRLWLVPEKGREPARLEYRLASADSLIALGPTATPQRLRNLILNGSVTPEKGRLEVADLRVLLEGAPVRLTALLYRGADPLASPGIKADIAVNGPVSIQTLYAFWPEQIAKSVRDFTVSRLHTATVTRSSVHADIPPGQLDKGRLTNSMLRVAFSYTNGGVKVSPTLPGIEQAVGQGVAQGNRFDLTMSTGRVGKLAISDAVVTVPRFQPSGAVATVRSRAQGDLGDMLRLVDSPPLHMMASSSMSPDRFSGPADMVIEIKRPLRKGVTAADHRVTFEGRLTGLRIKDVTLGEELTGGEMVTSGTLDYVEAEGTGKVGPYGGKIAFRMPLKGPEAGRKYIDLDGRVSIASAPGAVFQAAINTRNGIGGALVRSRLFEGEAQWRTRERMSADGVGEPAFWRQAGLPAGPGLPDRVPVRLAMLFKDGAWSGDLEADAYSGQLAYVKGPTRVVRYNAEITPDEARRIGVGKLPMFERTQAVALDARIGAGVGSANYAVGGLDGRLEWSPGGRYRFATTLDGDDLKGLGLPLTLENPVAVSTQATGGDGVLTLQRITVDAKGMAVRGSGSVSRDGVLSVDLPSARIEGFFDGSVKARRDKSGAQAEVSGRYLDFRTILKEAQRVAGGRNGAAGGDLGLLKLDAAIDRVRVTDSGYVRDVKLSGSWGAPEQRRVSLTAVSEGGGAVSIRAYPDKGATALSLQVADLGDIAKTLGGYDNLRGGATTGYGRIVEGGYDFDFEIRDMTILRVPGAAQLVATNGAIQFDRVVAPMRIRGSKVTLGDVRATGRSVGLTAKGIMDTKTRTMDVVGVVTPAYLLNAAWGRAFGSREGEGLFGITYRATGAFTAPNIAINPLSIAAPGALRRMFENPTPEHAAD